MERESQGRADLVVRTGPLTVDLGRRTATVDGVEIAMSPRVWALLAYLAERGGRWCLDREIRHAIWEDSGDALALASKVVNITRARLRASLGQAATLIECAPGKRPGTTRTRLVLVEPTP